LSAGLVAWLFYVRPVPATGTHGWRNEHGAGNTLDVFHINNMAHAFKYNSRGVSPAICKEQTVMNLSFKPDTALEIAIDAVTPYAIKHNVDNANRKVLWSMCYGCIQCRL